MGVKHLWDILESCKKTVPLHHLQNKRICIDLSCWIVQLQNVGKSISCVKEKVHLRGLFHRIRALIALNCSLIFVTDGSIPAIKLSTYRQRLNSGKDVTQNGSNLQKMSSLPRNRGSEFSCMIKEARILGMALGIPCLNGMDVSVQIQIYFFLVQGQCIGISALEMGGMLFAMRWKTLKENLDLEGIHCDYNQGVYGLGPESACQIVRSIGDKHVLQKFASEGIECLKRLKGAKKQGQVLKDNNKENMLDHDMALSHACQVQISVSIFFVHAGGGNNSQRDYNFLQVINAYVKPKCHPVDSDIVMRVLAQYPFQRSKLQQICAEFFQWPPEKTDEYVLPKIAERDLRRFANMRLTSSEVGLNLPLNEIPVKCPVSEIIKCRKVQGRECYEVSWNEMDGLGTSIIPADLLKSACPEKILEFDEKKGLLKKQNAQKRRPKKTETASSMAELDLQLTNLSLNIELGDHANHNASDSSEQVFQDASAVDEAYLNNRDLSSSSLDEQIEWNQNVRNTSDGQQSDSVAKNEVIDLLSPSPTKQLYASSKCQQFIGEHVEVINLSESESDTSPEHKRKAKELRMFLAGIKNDLH
ncbi:flap endonuclease GEN-like 2 isoform X4 [Neltuma alba]|uniref:flap endonuclease GEN-like 2 isoform X4 n=1 Tax=Neltuma alba TaxID=207710 RepID=UPI0010A57411|nr:flap endonuclease GEN-like 2 isoform X4 [Prosopis alba]